MFESGKKGNAAKKAYEIAYALFRLSAKISEESIKTKLESYGIDLLTSVNAEEYGTAAKALAAIDCLVKIAVDLNIVNISNGDVLFREVGNMSEAINECTDKSDDVDAAKFFSVPEAKKRNQPVIVPGSGRSLDTVIPMSSRTTARENFSTVMPMAVASSHISTQEAVKMDTGPVSRRDDQESGNSQSGNTASALRSGNRQIAILDRIRQSGNCKLKEIQEILPDCSERTIRYDLEELIERNLVERIGAGGPSVSYRMRQIA